MADEDRERDDKGRFISEQDIGLDDVYAAFERVDEPTSTREIADELGIPRRSALRYLDSLADDGRITKKKIDERRAVWFKTT